jgi:hypothetical protein
MKLVFLLYHSHTHPSLPGGEDNKLLGTFSTKELAIAAQHNASLLDGFKDAIDGFHISELELDKQQWQSGFVTETIGSNTPRYFIAQAGHWITIDGKIKTGYNYEKRTLICMAINEEEAKQKLEQEVLAYRKPYKNIYEQQVVYVFDKIYFIKESWFFDTEKINTGEVIEIDSCVKDKKGKSNIDATLIVPVIHNGGGLYDLLAKWKTVVNEYAHNENLMYEWQNDLDVRRLIDDKLHKLDSSSKTYFLRKTGLYQLDKIFKQKTVEVSECIWGQKIETENKYNRKKNWYYYRVNQLVLDSDKKEITKK